MTTVQNCKKWVDEAMQLLSASDVTPERISMAMELKAKNLPAAVYKYREVSKYSLSNLRDSTLYLSSANAFNDPYDSAMIYDPLFGVSHAEALLGEIDLSEAEKQSILSADDPVVALVEAVIAGAEPALINEASSMARILKEGHEKFKMEQMIAMNAQIQSMYKICSLSERLDSLPLWAHYAKDHSGFAMEYDFKSLAFSDISSSLWPVRYVGIFDASNLLRGYKKGASFNNLFAFMAALHKSPDWSYEQEWRLVIPDGPGSPSRNFAVPLKAVYLGAKISDVDEAKVRECAAQANVPVYRMRLVPHLFKMEAVI
ncbi:DUF2971 domain-containing protein [Pseudomonas monteilii]|uniref:DUF2971 domain-containing protein n=1 Tax=Pseudomonas monteilii TaxID=76759 RepID=UPI001CBF5125|nr:DUF2971 domain-containing protein [Pseudomonas monteilii]MBZ3661998.1 DUF2971 domain-containing protein [Pseudomonas monteilii]MBZ3667324.1 DUF2971 domain-containing protein [Pseudomonas monteilii]